MAHFQQILDQYDKLSLLNSQFVARSANLVEELLRAEQIRVHSVQKRIKDRDKLAEKIARPNKNYTCLDEITDISGIRVITYFEDEVDKVAEIIKREFQIIEAFTEDKRASLEPTQFGYLSLHHVCEWSYSRTEHTENRVFKGLRFEIQVRSLLQHVWAEIEHDLGYKAGAPIPSVIRRRFSQLAGLLEIADREFKEIRNTLQQYAKDTEAELSRQPVVIEPEELAEKTSFIALDDVTITTLVQQSEDIARINGTFARERNVKFAPETVIASNIATIMHSIGVFVVDYLRSVIKRNVGALEQYVLRKFPHGGTNPGHDEDPALCLYLIAEAIAVWTAGAEGLAYMYAQLEGGKGFEKGMEIAEANAALISSIDWPYKWVLDLTTEILERRPTRNDERSTPH